MPRRIQKDNKTSRNSKLNSLVRPQRTGLGQVADKLLGLYRKNSHRGTSVDIVYWTIRQAIRSGLVISGAHLTELDLANVLRISRTPIREALQRLEMEYLLQKSPRRGFVVPVLALNDIVEIFEVREVLLGLAARCAAQHASSTEIVLMEQSIVSMERARDTGDVEGLSQASAQFHRTIELASKNRRLQNLIRLNSGALPLYEFTDPERFAPVIAEHRAIFDAIAAHDANLAERLAQEHSRNALQAQTRATQMIGALVRD
jgi:DNA-binding GntR family transcriptional regulator